MLHICEAPAGVAHLVERHLSKGEVASARLGFGSKREDRSRLLLFSHMAT